MNERGVLVIVLTSAISVLRTGGSVLDTPISVLRTERSVLGTSQVC